MQKAHLNEHSSYEETAATHVVPCQGITRKQLLRVKPQQVELERIPTWQITQQVDKVTGLITEVRDEIVKNRVVWKSDRTLLSTQKVESKLPGLMREGAIREGGNTQKIRRFEQEISPEPVEIGPAVEGVYFEENE